MARDFYSTFPSAVMVFDEASEALGLSLSDLCFGNDPRLNLTEFAQPSIITAEIAMLRSLQSEFGLCPTHFGGHSLGEYSALVAAGVMSISQAVNIVRERGRQMQTMIPPGRGAMVAVTQRRIQPETVAGLLSGLVVDIANINAPGQIVLSGALDDVKVALKRLQDHSLGSGARFKMLTVSAPFHSRLMAPMEPEFRKLLDQASTSWMVDRATTVVSNFTGRFYQGTRELLVDALTRQISGQVRWVDNMRTLAAVAPERLLEIGPESPLRGFFQLIRVRVDAITSVSTALKALG